MGSQTKWELPLVDFSGEKMKPGSDVWISARQVVRSAFEDQGAFTALYDKPESQHLHNSFYSAMKQLFDLPLQTKLRKTTDKPIFTRAGDRPAIPLYESLAIFNPVSLQDCHHYTNVMWPQGNDTFCETVNLYVKHVAELDRMVKRMLFESVGLETEKYEAFMASMEYVVRGYKYRPPAIDKGETNLGLPAHSDPAFITILNQHVEGLEVRLKNGEWAQVGASHSLYLVIGGHALKVWSNDRLSTGWHRVFVNSKVDRYSMGLLTYVNKIMEPEEKLVDEEHPLRYKSFNHYDYLRYFTTEEAFRKIPHRIQAFCGISDTP